MKGTDDVLEFGDMIELDLTEDLPNGHVKHRHLECKFIDEPEIIDMLLDTDVIEVREVEDPEENINKPLDFEDNCPLIEELVRANENLEHRVYNLEKAVIILKQEVTMLKKNKKKVNPQANDK